ncbi:hypothetical protein [Chroococcidiopsis sp.]|uniref:hypothetical protein n=1 Tax=Chroococcidiopsis sp. TaxID=3088168 RepID=UPI003F2E4CE1
MFDLPDSPAANSTDSSRLLAPVEIIDVMIDLRIQMSELEQQIQSLQPAFFAACLALNTDKIALERAIITRKLTPGQWTYSPDIGEQEALLKQLKRQFQQLHEPTSGRDVTWAIKLLLTTA